MPKSVRGMVGSGDDFSYRVHYRFHRDAFDETHPFCYTTEFPVLSDRIKVEGLALTRTLTLALTLTLTPNPNPGRIKVEGRQWLEPITKP